MKKILIPFIGFIIFSFVTFIIFTDPFSFYPVPETFSPGNGIAIMGFGSFIGLFALAFFVIMVKEILWLLYKTVKKTDITQFSALKNEKSLNPVYEMLIGLLISAFGYYILVRADSNLGFPFSGVGIMIFIFGFAGLINRAFNGKL